MQKTSLVWIDRVTVSLDAIEDEIVQDISNSTISSNDIIRESKRTLEHGLEVKVNTVIIKNYNEHQIIPITERFSEMGVSVDLLNMDVGGTKKLNPEQVVFGMRYAP